LGGDAQSAFTAAFFDIHCLSRPAAARTPSTVPRRRAKRLIADRLDPGVQPAAYRIVQEALANA
jgi:signal transduction histidine kinase